MPRLHLILTAFLAAAAPASASTGYVDGYFRSVMAAPVDPKVTPAWAASTAYAANAAVIGPDGLTLYKATAACTSGSTGPTGYNTGIADGTCAWNPLGQANIQNTTIDLVAHYGHISLSGNSVTITGLDTGVLTLSETAGLSFSAGSTVVAPAKITTPALTLTGALKLADASTLNGTCTASIGSACVPPIGTSTNTARDGALAVAAEQAAAASQGSLAGVSTVAGNVTGTITGAAPNKTLTLTAPAGTAPPASAGYLATNGSGAYVADSFSADFATTSGVTSLNMPAGEFPYRPSTGNLTYAAYVPRTAWPTLPSITAATPGDLTVSCSTQTGMYWRLGNAVHVSFSVTCTPTYTTASGTLQITGLPFTSATGAIQPLVVSSPMGTFTWPGTSPTMLQPQVSGGTNYIQIASFKSASGGTGTLAITAIASGTAFTFSGEGEYDIGSSQ